MTWGPEEFAKHNFPRSTRKIPVYATLLKHPNCGVTAKEINEENGFKTDDATIEETRRVLREVEAIIDIELRKNPVGTQTKVYKPGHLLNSYKDPLYLHVLGKKRDGFSDYRANPILRCPDPMHCANKECKICSKAGIRTCWDQKKD